MILFFKRTLSFLVTKERKASCAPEGSEGVLGDGRAHVAGFWASRIRRASQRCKIFYTQLLFVFPFRDSYFLWQK